MKYIKNNANEKIKDKINIINIELLKLSNIVTGKYRDDIKEKLQDIAKKTKLTNTQKDNIYNRLYETERDLNTIKKIREIHL